MSEENEVDIFEGMTPNEAVAMMATAENPADILDRILKRFAERTGAEFEDDYEANMEALRQFYAQGMELSDIADTDWPMWIDAKGEAE